MRPTPTQPDPADADLIAVQLARRAGVRQCVERLRDEADRLFPAGGVPVPLRTVEQYAFAARLLRAIAADLERDGSDGNSLRNSNTHKEG